MTASDRATDNTVGSAPQRMYGAQTAVAMLLMVTVFSVPHAVGGVSVAAWRTGLVTAGLLVAGVLAWVNDGSARSWAYVIGAAVSVSGLVALSLGA
ncbi:hypothetical protein DLJ61_20605 [Gordonia terrae]|uniref:Uncharacterized protein n=2 Tax=Gordonia terrae TaxID=2055 RepID=A0AAD0K9U5_9ACTN|nr:hypothetical protein BCM27_20390 [Gordonia terrae]AWO85595.1 hypothetical protein DLJ61_20605 [Gordonia terrae]GAB45181.1 hypothetical protein GOTRE_109_00500 [Gordonia terrae NBRC 100016]VTR12357.1 Uncharacterised protein [Clostridioides difficile]VTS60527.1 Uncharacterised protein [Gordonia terrae]